MGQMSEEQKKDLKIKLVILALILMVGGVGAFLGPYLPVYEKKLVKNASQPGTAKKLYWVGVVFDATGRDDKAMDTFANIWLLYGDDYEGGEHDWEELAGHSDLVGNTDWPQDTYMPWRVKVLEDQDKDRPKPVFSNKETRKYMGLGFSRAAAIMWDKRAYHASDHLYACLRYLWPKGSELAVEGADRYKAKNSRR